MSELTWSWLSHNQTSVKSGCHILRSQRIQKLLLAMLEQPTKSSKLHMMSSNCDSRGVRSSQDSKYYTGTFKNHFVVVIICIFGAQRSKKNQKENSGLKLECFWNGFKLDIKRLTSLCSTFWPLVIQKIRLKFELACILFLRETNSPSNALCAIKY